MPTLYLIDASVFVFRAFFAVSDRVRDPKGAPANAVLGFGTFLCELLEQRNPAFIAAAFDESLTQSFRNQLYPAYKANRPEAPPELIYQFRICRELCAALGVAAFASQTHEADDLIGTLAALARPHGFDMLYLTADKDLAQLIRDRDRLWDPGRGRMLDALTVLDEFGVRPEQMVDLLGLAGDAVDNIPGVPGIGRKTAAALLAALQDLDGIYAGLPRIAELGLRGAARLRRLLDQHREQAYLSRRLATIDCAAPLEVAPTALAWRGADPEALAALPLPAGLKRRAMRLIVPPLPLEP